MPASPFQKAHVVAVAPVPFREAVAGEGADLVGPGGVPRLGDDLGVAQDGVLGDVFHDGRVGQQFAVLIAGEHGGEVEAEAVDVHVQVTQ
jgi:hypothetical protein